MAKEYPFVRIGALEQGIWDEIQELYDKKCNVKHNKKDYYNWELTYNRIELQIDRLYKEVKVAEILES